MVRNNPRSAPVGCFVGTALVLFPAMLGLVSGLLADGTLPTLLVLVAEPAVWLALGVIAIGCLATRQWAPAAGAGGGWLLFALSLRFPIVPDNAQRLGIDLQTTARACRKAADTENHRSVSVVSWNINGQDAHAVALATRDLDADILVLQEVAGSEVVEELAALWDGEPLFAESMRGVGTGIVVRNGTFLRCDAAGLTDAAGARARSYWTFPLPAQHARRAIAVLAFASIPDAGTIPIVAVHLDRPGSPSELFGWNDTLERSATRLAAIARKLRLPNLVLVGDTNTHGTFRQFHADIAGTTLSAAPARATWPAAVGGVPTLPLYHLDRLWHGEAWTTASVTTLRLNRWSDHLALSTTLAPVAAPAGLKRTQSR